MLLGFHPILRIFLSVCMRDMVIRQLWHLENQAFSILREKEKEKCFWQYFMQRCAYHISRSCTPHSPVPPIHFIFNGCKVTSCVLLALFVNAKVCYFTPVNHLFF